MTMRMAGRRRHLSPVSRRVKMTRGDVSTPGSNSVRNWDYFKKYDFHEVEDTVLREQVIALEKK